MNSYPQEVENSLALHPKVLDVAVIDALPRTPTGKLVKRELRSPVS